MELIAYRRGLRPSYTMDLVPVPKARPWMDLVPAPRERPWMDRTPGVKRCLPLRIANEAAWWILNPEPFAAVWTGDVSELGVQVVGASPGQRESPASSASSARFGYVGTNFGHGILTFVIPYLFRTPPGWNLHVRGPANLPKHGVSPLEGIVETDWSIATFTMNWKFTFPNVPVRFDAGEPIAQIVPVRRGDLESFEPRVVPIEEEANLFGRYSGWKEARDTHHVPAHSLEESGDLEKVVERQREWNGAYARGRFPDEEVRFEGHQTKLRLKPFVDDGSQANEGGQP